MLHTWTPQISWEDLQLSLDFCFGGGGGGGRRGGRVYFYSSPVLFFLSVFSHRCCSVKFGSIVPNISRTTALPTTNSMLLKRTLLKRCVDRRVLLSTTCCIMFLLRLLGYENAKTWVISIPPGLSNGVDVRIARDFRGGATDNSRFLLTTLSCTKHAIN